MPQFVDYHKQVPPPSPEIVQAMWEAAAVGRSDPFGVRIIDQYAAGDGQAFCVTEAPDAEAIRKSHQAIGAPVSDTITEVQSIL